VHPAAFWHSGTRSSRIPQGPPHVRLRCHPGPPAHGPLKFGDSRWCQGKRVLPWLAPEPTVREGRRTLGAESSQGELRLAPRHWLRAHFHRPTHTRPDGRTHMSGAARAGIPLRNEDVHIDARQRRSASFRRVPGSRHARTGRAGRQSVARRRGGHRASQFRIGWLYRPYHVVPAPDGSAP
jgi:hypothetical protein